MKILFADDSAVARSLVNAVLTAQGHEVVTVESGSEAWELWQRTQHRVVVADWMMPGMDGLELCRKIRAHAQGRHTYFILQTVRASGSGEATEAGVSAYITKPIVPADLINCLKEASLVLGL